MIFKDGMEKNHGIMMGINHRIVDEKVIHQPLYILEKYPHVSWDFYGISSCFYPLLNGCINQPYHLPGFV